MNATQLWYKPRLSDYMIKQIVWIAHQKATVLLGKRKEMSWHPFPLLTHGHFAARAMAPAKDERQYQDGVQSAFFLFVKAGFMQ